MKIIICVPHYTRYSISFVFYNVHHLILSFISFYNSMYIPRNYFHLRSNSHILSQSFTFSFCIVPHATNIIKIHFMIVQIHIFLFFSNSIYHTNYKYIIYIILIIIFIIKIIILK